MSEESLKITRWWWVRHAPVSDHGGCVYGQRDLDADCTDGQAFGFLAQTLPSRAQVVISNLRRTQQTAHAVQAHGGGRAWADAIVEPDFAEQNFGAWQGKTHDEISAWGDTIGQNFWVAPATSRAPDGESFTDVVARVAPAIYRFSDQFAGQHIVCFAHYGTIMAALAVALHGGLDAAMVFQIGNLSITRIDCLDKSTTARQRQWRVCGVNWRQEGG